MSSLTNAMEAHVVNHFLRNTAVTSPSAVYLALYPTDPGEDDSGIEASYTGYARQEVTFTAIDSTGKTQNSVPVIFADNEDQVSANVRFVGVVTEEIVGNGELLLHAPLGVEKELDTGEGLTFKTGGCAFTLD